MNSGWSTRLSHWEGGLVGVTEAQGAGRTGRGRCTGKTGVERDMLQGGVNWSGEALVKWVKKAAYARIRRVFPNYLQ